MNVEQKAWGTTVPLLQTPLVEMHRIEVRPDMRCSMHIHRRKWNCFLVLSGVLTIETEIAGGERVFEALRPGEVTTVRPGDYHRFLTGDAPAVAVELYYLDVLSEDIVRRDIGGRRWAAANTLPMSRFHAP